MPTPSMKRKPSRMVLSNLLTGEDLEAQFNPTELNEKFGVNWGEQPVLGLSHLPHQFQQTINPTFDFELAFRAFDDDGNKLDDNRRARRFLMAACLPSRGSTDVVGGSPARLLFMWPKLISLTCVVHACDFKHTLFNIEGDPIHSAAKLTLKEIRDGRMYAEDVFEQGTIRSAG